MNKQEKADLKKACARVSKELRQVCQKLLEQSMLDLVTDSKSKLLEFKEIRAFMKGLKTGAQFYSEGIVVILNDLTNEKGLHHLVTKLKELNDQQIFALIDSIAPPPPEAQRIHLND
jgi:glutamyl-tRNA reductase